MEGRISVTAVPTTFRLPANVFMWLSLAMIVLGVAGSLYGQWVGHHQAFGTSREMPWGMLIGVYAYLAIISTGLCVLAAFSHIFGGNRMAPLANRMVWLSVIMLLAAFTVIGLEIENPWRMPLGVVLHANVTSNIWWMGTLYGLAVGVMFLELFLILTRRFGAAIVLGVAGAIIEALANSNLGSVFASLHSRPFWYGSQLPVFFLACAILSGAAATVLFTHYSHLLHRRPMAQTTFQALQTAGKIMVLMLFMVGLATVWKFANAYCSTDEMMLAADALVEGPLATQFWLFEVAIGLVLPGVLLVFSRLNSVYALSTAGLMVLVGQFFARYNLVVSGQIVSSQHDTFGAATYIGYAPAAAEYLLLLAGIGVVCFGFFLGERHFDRLFAGDGSH